MYVNIGTSEMQPLLINIWTKHQIQSISQSLAQSHCFISMWSCLSVSHIHMIPAENRLYYSGVSCAICTCSCWKPLVGKTNLGKSHCCVERFHAASDPTMLYPQQQHKHFKCTHLHYRALRLYLIPKCELLNARKSICCSTMQTSIIDTACIL